MKTKDRILHISIELFNRSGVAEVSTNHIAKALNISPGNLYFHFENKEEIVRQIFKMMAAETYQIWKTPKTAAIPHPLKVIDLNFEVFWKYRFFHREMHYLRRRDPELSKMWRDHIHKVLKIMTLMYKRWLKKGYFSPIQSPNEVDFLVNILLATASTFLQFFESADKVPVKKQADTGKKYVIQLLSKYSEGPMRVEFDNYLSQS
jgi:AcrR family transcriptional regulator